MSNLNTRIATLEGKTATTPITMKGLADRLANLESTAKKWEIVTLPYIDYYPIGDHRYGPIPEKYRTGYDFILVECGVNIKDSNSTLSAGCSSKTIYASKAGASGLEINASVSIVGDQMKIYVKDKNNYNKSAIKVMFYK